MHINNRLRWAALRGHRFNSYYGYLAGLGAGAGAGLGLGLGLGFWGGFTGAGTEVLVPCPRGAHPLHRYRQQEKYDTEPTYIAIRSWMKSSSSFSVSDLGSNSWVTVVLDKHNRSVSSSYYSLDGADLLVDNVDTEGSLHRLGDGHHGGSLLHSRIERLGHDGGIPGGGEGWSQRRR